GEDEATRAVDGYALLQPPLGGGATFIFPECGQATVWAVPSHFQGQARWCRVPPHCGARAASAAAATRFVRRPSPTASLSQSGWEQHDASALALGTAAAANPAFTAALHVRYNPVTNVCSSRWRFEP